MKRAALPLLAWLLVLLSLPRLPALPRANCLNIFKKRKNIIYVYHCLYYIAPLIRVIDKPHRKKKNTQATKAAKFEHNRLVAMYWSTEGAFCLFVINIA